MDSLPGQARPPDVAVQTSHVREMAANLLLGRALQVLDAAGGMVVFWDAEGRWNKDSFSLPGRPDRLEQLAPVLEALLEWTLYTEKPVAIDDLRRSRWSRHLLHGDDPPAGAAAATPMHSGERSGGPWPSTVPSPSPTPSDCSASSPSSPPSR